MPVYEYRCRSCRRRFSALVGVVASAAAPACPRCGSAEADRLVSRFNRVRSEDDVLDSLADSAELGDVDENDPASVSRWMKRMGSEMGEDFGDDFEQALEEEMSAADADDAGDADLL